MLSYIMVLLVAVVVGLAVYVLVLRLGMQRPPTDVGEAAAPSTTQFAPQSETRPETGSQTRPERRMAPEGAYVPVSPASPSWHSRLGGVMGLVIAVTGAALGIAAGLYLVGHLVARLLHSAAP